METPAGGKAHQPPAESGMYFRSGILLCNLSTLGSKIFTTAQYP